MAWGLCADPCPRMRRELGNTELMALGYILSVFTPAEVLPPGFLGFPFPLTGHRGQLLFPTDALRKVCEFSPI